MDVHKWCQAVREHVLHNRAHGSSYLLPVLIIFGEDEPYVDIYNARGTFFYTIIVGQSWKPAKP